VRSVAKRALMLLSNEFRPDPRVAKEARALSAAGFEVSVLAWNRAQKAPHREMYHHTSIERVTTGKVRGPLSLALNYPLCFLAALSAALRQPIDAVHSHDFDTLLLGVVVSRIKRIPLVYDAHEHYAMMVATDLPKPLTQLMDRLEAILVRRAALVIAANEKIAEYLRPHVRGRLTVVSNCIDLPEMTASVARSEGRLKIFYAGALEPLRFIEECADAVRKRDDCMLSVAGQGRLEEDMERRAGEKVAFLGYLDYPEMLNRMSRCHVVLCLMDPSNENNRIGTPNKLYEGMALGIPLLTSRRTLAGDIVEREGCGLAIDWSEESFNDAVSVLKDDETRAKMGRAGRKAAESKYNWAAMRGRLIDEYSRL